MNNITIQLKVKERLNKLDSQDFDNLQAWQIIEAFNKGQVDMVNLYFFYCINQTLEQYTKVVVPLKHGRLTKDDLLTNILKYRINDGRRFNINGIHAYQFDSEIIEFLKNNECSTKEHLQVEDIEFKPMVELFQHYSSIFIILNNEKTRHTKKMYETKRDKRKTAKA
jgi:hypothetical protein